MKTKTIYQELRIHEDIKPMLICKYDYISVLLDRFEYCNWTQKKLIKSYKNSRWPKIGNSAIKKKRKKRRHIII